MRVYLDYGQKKLEVVVPESSNVLLPQHRVQLADEDRAIRRALLNPIGTPPLRSLVSRGQRVVIVHSDLTRAMPNDRVLPILLEALEDAGTLPDQITLINGLGTHRPQTRKELVGMLGNAIVETYRCESHDCHATERLVDLGETQFGHPIRVNRTYMEADVKILTGFIEPHFFAGYSGGPKAVLPGIAGLESIMANHGKEMVDHKLATWGKTRGNPIWEEMRQVALRTDPAFLLNVTLNRQHGITGVFAGELFKVHAMGCSYCGASALQTVPHRYDIVLTTNSGYPLDLNLYQAVKGLSVAARVVKRGGVIILAAECREGVPQDGSFAQLLRSVSGPDEFVDWCKQKGYSHLDQWQAQILAKVLKWAQVYVYSEGLSAEEIKSAWMLPCRDIDRLVATLVGSDTSATLCVLPSGPQVIPVLKGAK